MSDEELNQHLSNALEELRRCVVALGDDKEQRELLYHAGRTINTLMCLRRPPSTNAIVPEFAP